MIKNQQQRGFGFSSQIKNTAFLAAPSCLNWHSQFGMAEVWHGSEQSFHISFGIVLVTLRRSATLISH